MCGKEYGQDVRQSLRHKHSPLNFHFIQQGNISFHFISEWFFTENREIASVVMRP